MILSGHQPVYLPFIGLFHKIALSDVFMFVDQVQLEKKSWQNRNRIRTREGWAWLSVPVLTAGKFDQLIADTKIDEKLPWRRKHWRALQTSYGKAPYFSRYGGFFEQLYREDWDSLAVLNKTVIVFLIQEFGIKTHIVEQADFPKTQAKTAMLVEMCQHVHADTYLSNEGSRAYVDESLFEKTGLSHRWQVFHHPTYPQCFEPFVPYLSALDLLFNVGPQSMEIVMQANAA